MSLWYLILQYKNKYSWSCCHEKIDFSSHNNKKSVSLFLFCFYGKQYYRFLIGCTLERFQISQSVILEKQVSFSISKKKRKSKSNMFNTKVRVNEFQLITNFSIVISKTPSHVFFSTNYVDVSNILGMYLCPAGPKGRDVIICMVHFGQKFNLFC